MLGTWSHLKRLQIPETQHQELWWMVSWWEFAPLGGGAKISSNTTGGSCRGMQPTSGRPAFPVMNLIQWANGGPVRLRCDHNEQLVGWKFSSVLLRLLWGSIHRIVLHFAH